MPKDKKDKAEDKDKNIDDVMFDCVMTMASAFEEKKKNDLKIAWEEIKPEIEKLSQTGLEILLGLVKTKG